MPTLIASGTTQILLATGVGVVAIVIGGIGVGLANQGGNEAKALDLLRAARMFDPSSAYVVRNLVILLHGQGVRRVNALTSHNPNVYGRSTEMGEAVAMLEEAVLIGTDWLARNRDQDIRALVEKVVGDYTLVKNRWGSLTTGSPRFGSVPDPSLEGALALVRRLNVL